jgi:hypothetical protein
MASPSNYIFQLYDVSLVQKHEAGTLEKHAELLSKLMIPFETINKNVKFWAIHISNNEWLNILHLFTAEDVK